MKITKYPQSCLLLERDGTRLLIDPGVLVAQKFSAQQLMPVDAILITHEHPDHADAEFIRALVGGNATPVISNEGVKNALGDDVVTRVVQDGENFEVGNFQVTAHVLPHVAMMDGTTGPQNTGYVIDGIFLAPGDSVDVRDIRVEKLAVPLAGPDVSPRDGMDLIKQVGATTVVPIHYDVFLANPGDIAERAKKIVPNARFVVLGDGESAEI
jgi:L-ascorbate metabolism protein UlaG (beta-lactamase superfamily)